MLIAKRTLFAGTCVLLAYTGGALAESLAPVKIAIPVFLSGPGAGAFGEPS